MNPDGTFAIEHWRIELKVDWDSESELDPDEGLVGIGGDVTSNGEVWETASTCLTRARRSMRMALSYWFAKRSLPDPMLVAPR